ncbi:response regulator [Sandarakinorhabdus oryzae]|uniref:response regulator n=1 Tax=Sandarakinorhabdus oryzae TaxID=2675220 RepID=UPI0012E17928|nr:response regulator [Sandarakinorhabdus oryzae]
MKILLVEDDRMLAAAIVDGLGSRFGVEWVETLADAELAIMTEPVDLVILDLSMPDGSGLDLLRRWRAAGRSEPVLILTARDSVADRIAGLNTGADDYVTKPFDLDELTARCEALRRRAHGRASPMIQHGALSYEPSAQIVLREGQNVPLSARELAIFDVLVSNIGRVISRKQIEERLYRWNEMVESNAVEVHVSHLRRKLGRDMIKTIRGLGYVIPRAP